jgi:DNA-binding NtrC family response regulator
VTTPPRPRVLVVDDEIQVAETLAECVGRFAEVEVVTRGADALEALGRARSPVVLLDMSMPGMSGLEVLRRIRETDPTIVVLMITASEDTFAIGEALELGAFSYIPKPFKLEYVEHLVTAALSKARRSGPPGV